MIITGNSILAGAGITGNPASSTGAGSTPASASPAKFYCPAGDISRWTAGIDNPAGNQDWKITKGNDSPGDWYMTPTTNGSQWEIQHPLSGPEDLLEYGFNSRFTCYFRDTDSASVEGKDFLEVRMVIPDSAVASWINIPPATPDKPYLVVGFIARCVGGELRFYDLNDDSKFSNTFLSVSLDGYVDFSLELIGGNFWGAFSDGTVNRKAYLEASRTGESTPLNTLYIRSGANPLKNTGFKYLKSVVPHEEISRELTLEDANATFYCPWGYGRAINLELPDIPFPEGFCVNLLIEDKAEATINPGDFRHVLCADFNGIPSSDGYTLSGKCTLIQTEKNGKTWLLIKQPLIQE